MKRLVPFIPILIFIGIGIFVAACTQQQKEEPKTEVAATDPLPSWNDTPTKKAIIDFVTAVTTEGSSKFVPAAERIATFDNDGTLWCEQPLYFEFVYSIAATREIGKVQHALITKPEMKALVAGDMKTFMQSGEKGLLEALAISHTAISIDEFDASAKAWLDTAVHKRFGRKYGELTYLPMVELLNYLRDNQFKTFIVSGGSSMFVRTFSEKAYGIPPDQVVGTMFKSEWVQKSISYNVVLKPEIFYLDDNVGKPVAIYQFIGRKPILAFGNSDGDLQMLQWTSTNSRPNLSLILHHTDSVREYAYDRESHIGKLDKALDEGQQKGWVIVDMKADWNKVYSFEK
jgi:phosphoglycolate phosphatase-like HAD superfamily hydrolase